MRAYQNEVWDMFANLFLKHEISLICREENGITNSMTNVSSTFWIPLYSNKKYEINVKHKPSISDNIRHWKYFEDDYEIKIFLKRKNEFINAQNNKNDDKTT